MKEIAVQPLSLSFWIKQDDESKAFLETFVPETKMKVIFGDTPGDHRFVLVRDDDFHGSKAVVEAFRLLKAKYTQRYPEEKIYATIFELPNFYKPIKLPQ